MENSRVTERELLVAVFVRDRRKAGGLTQVQLGELAGVGKRFVVELEQGKPTLRMDKVNQVLAVFGRQLGPVAKNKSRIDFPASSAEINPGFVFDREGKEESL